MKKKMGTLRYQIGIFFIILAIISPGLALLVPLLGLSAALTTAVIGILFIGAPEVFLIIGVALAGKEFLNLVKKKAKMLFGLDTPLRPVGKIQYRIGLFLLVGSILANWSLQYLAQTIDLGIGHETTLIIISSIDLITISSFFILGGQFWEKFCRLFVWEGNMIRHIVVLHFQKGHHKNYQALLEKTRPILSQIPGIVSYQIFPNDSKYVPEEVSSLGVEIIFKNKEALDHFMEHPKHYEANAVFEKYLADPPYTVLTHSM